MEDYYRRRAEEYEEIYQQNEPARQKELRKIADELRETLRNRMVIEIACGTGYWTQILSETAQNIVAADIASEMLEIAKRKHYICPVSFSKEDAYELSFTDVSFNGGLANFWLSHVPRSRIDFFLKEFYRVLRHGSRIFMADNVYVPNSGGNLLAEEDDENTYKLRKLKDGSEHLVLKNYFSVDELMRIFGKYTKGFNRENVFCGKYYWCMSYELR